MIGLVFAESKRRVDIALAKEIVSAVRSWRTSRHGDRGNNDDLRDAPSDNDNTNATTNTIKTYQSLAKGLRLHVGRTGPLVVGVFANNSVEQVNLIANEVGLDYVQLSGHEGFAAVQQIAHPCIRAIHVGGAVSANSALKLIEPGPNAILLDTMDPCGALGGTGRAFSWDIAVQLSQQQVPFFLAGGLTIDNVKAAILKTRPFGIDVSSGVEENGEKSANKIHRFIEQAMLKQTNPL
jgi:phosphoribosylanthranilate isomerase